MGMLMRRHILIIFLIFVSFYDHFILSLFNFVFRMLYLSLQFAFIFMYVQGKNRITKTKPNQLSAKKNLTLNTGGHNVQTFRNDHIYNTFN